MSGTKKRAAVSPIAPDCVKGGNPAQTSLLSDRFDRKPETSFPCIVRAPQSFGHGGHHAGLAVEMFAEESLAAQCRRSLQEAGFVELSGKRSQPNLSVTDWLAHDSALGQFVHLRLHGWLAGDPDASNQDDPNSDAPVSVAALCTAAGKLPNRPSALDAHLLLASQVFGTSFWQRMVARLSGQTVTSSETNQCMAVLLAQTSPESLTYWGRALWGTAHWRRMAPHLHAAQWSCPESFHVLSGEVRTSRPWLHRHCFDASSTGELRESGWPRPFRGVFRSGIASKRVARLRQPAPIVAIVGSDGAGKSTIVQDLETWLAPWLRVQLVYLGSNHPRLRKLLGARRRMSPVPGTTGKAQPTTQSGAAGPRGRQPTLSAIKALAVAKMRRSLQRKAFRQARQGVVVITDRYPQTEFAGICDGPSLESPRDGALGRWLRSRELKLFHEMARSRPDLIIKLDVPLHIASARKPDHDPVSLQRKISILQNLTFAEAKVIVIDATQPLEIVTTQVRNQVWRAIRDISSNV